MPSPANRFPPGFARYWLLAAALFVGMAVHTLHGEWVGDFWEHAAVVRELATHPLAPRHPILDVNAPHAFFSPYSLTVAVVARTLSLTPVTALALAGLVNLAVFLLVFRWFIGRLFDDVEHYVVAFYGLLLLLLLWGPGAWLWSGFMHVFTLGYVLPYPATFAFVLTLLIAGSLLAWTKDRRLQWLGIVVPSMVVVVLTHPTTAIAMFIIAFWILVGDAGWPVFKSVGFAGAVFSATLLLALLWPYYDLASLLLQPSPDFHADSRALYSNVLSPVAPALVGLPLMAWRLFWNRRDILGLSFLSLGGLYLAGALTNQWGFGRLISMVMVLLQLTIAGALSTAETALVKRQPTKARRVRAALSAVVLGLLLFGVNSGTVETLRQTAIRDTTIQERYAFVRRLTGQYDVVVADLRTAWPVPALGGKVVASSNPIHFISDHQERRRLLGDFFAMETSDAERRSFLARFGADYILLDRTRQPPPLVSALSRLGQPIHDDGRLLLMRAANERGR